MTAKLIKVTSVVLGGPVFAFAVLWLGCFSPWPRFGDYCSPHALPGLFVVLTFVFWMCIPSGYLLVRVLRGKA
jgi:hypothetical protein